MGETPTATLDRLCELLDEAADVILELDRRDLGEIEQKVMDAADLSMMALESEDGPDFEAERP